MTGRPRVDYIEESPDTGLSRTPPAPGRQAMLLAALVIGGLLLAVQLWFLTVALELYLEGDGGRVWVLSVFSGLVFVGGLLVLRLLGRHAHVRT